MWWKHTLNFGCGCWTWRSHTCMETQRAAQGDDSSILLHLITAALNLRTSVIYKWIFHSVQPCVYIKLNRFMYVLGWYVPWLVLWIVIAPLEEINSLCCHLEVLRAASPCCSFLKTPRMFSTYRPAVSFFFLLTVDSRLKHINAVSCSKCTQSLLLFTHTMIALKRE